MVGALWGETDGGMEGGRDGQMKGGKERLGSLMPEDRERGGANSGPGEPGGSERAWRRSPPPWMPFDWNCWNFDCFSMAASLEYLQVNIMDLHIRNHSSFSCHELAF